MLSGSGPVQNAFVGSIALGRQWAIPLFNYTPLQMTINGVQGGIGNMSRGVVN